MDHGSLQKKKDIFQCYAPTNDTEGVVKDNFYNRLIPILQDKPKKDIVIIMIIMGDFKGKVEITKEDMKRTWTPGTRWDE